jgi:DNA-binding Lrp family transcriptional regulator
LGWDSSHSVTVFVEITAKFTQPQDAERLQNRLVAIPEISVCHSISGRATFLAEIRVRDVGTYERLLNTILWSLPGIAAIQSIISLRRLK